MPYVMSDRGDIVAILWADHDPLHAPPLPNVSNKILWVSRVSQGAFTPLRIRATLDGANQTVARQVADGPGPSIIDLPAAGCWSVNLSWSGHHDHLTLRYSASQLPQLARVDVGTGGASRPLSVMSDKATTDMLGTKGAERP
jgi:hypothetical protein